MRLPPVARGPTWRSLRDLALSQAVPLVASLVTTLVTARMLGPDGRGQLAFTIGIATLAAASIFCSIHIGIGRAVDDGDLAAPRRTVTASLSAVAVAIFLAAITWFAVPNITEGGALSKTTLACSLACAGILIFNLSALRTTQILGNSRVFRDSWIIQSTLYLAIGVPVAAITHEWLLVALSWALALLASAAWAWFRTPEFRKSAVGRRSRAPVKLNQILSDSVPSHLANVGQQLLIRADVVTLGILGAATAVGHYSIASAIAGIVWVLSEAASLYVLQQSGRGTTNSCATQLRAVVPGYLAVASAAAILLGVAAVILIPILLPGYEPAVWLTLLLLPGVVIQGVARIGLSAIARHRAHRSQVALGAVAAVLSLGYIPAIAMAGATGAAVTSTILYLLQALITVGFAMRIQRGSQYLSGPRLEPT